MKIVIAVAAFFAVMVVLFMGFDYEAKQPMIIADGWIMNVNITNSGGCCASTAIAFQSDGSSTPWSVNLHGELPELWQGEHVHILLHRSFGDEAWKFDKKEFKRLPSN